MEGFWYGIEMEWKKIASMEYGKIVFHSIPDHALDVGCDAIAIPDNNTVLLVAGRTL